MKRKILICVIILISVICGSDKINAIEIVQRSVPQAVIDTALAYKNLIDVGGNKSDKMIQKFLNSVGLKGNQPYCQAFVYYCFSANGIAEFRTGLANGYYASCKNKYGFHNAGITNKYGLIVWKYPNNSSGHIGFILRKTSPQYVQTIEGNTSWDDSSPDGRTYAGKKGVFVKQRRIGALGKMNLRGVVQ